MNTQPSPFLLAQQQALAQAKTMTDAQLGAAIRRLNMATCLAKAHAARIDDLEAENARLRALVPDEPSNVVEMPTSGSA